MGDLEEQADNGATAEVPTASQSTQTAASDAREHAGPNPYSEMPMLPIVWLYTAVGIPLLFLGIRDGWGYLFRSGDAASFIVGAVVGALVENIIELSRDKFAPLKKSFDRLGTFSRRPEDNNIVGFIIFVVSYYITVILLLYYLIAIIFTIWNIYFSFSDLTVDHPTVDWVQVACFFFPLGLLMIIRFIFTSESPFPLNRMEHFVNGSREK